MKETVLCYLEREGQYLMLYRNKKKNDPNGGKWIGVGGKCEADETPEQTLLREVREETGLTLTAWRYRGIVDFYSDCWDDERMHLFTATAWVGTPIPCDEGELHWVDKAAVPDLPLWEGDRRFLRRLAEDDSPFFRMSLHYTGDTLTAVTED